MGREIESDFSARVVIKTGLTGPDDWPKLIKYPHGANDAKEDTKVSRNLYEKPKGF